MAVAVAVRVLLVAALLQFACTQDLHEGSRCHNEEANRGGTCRRFTNCPWARDQRRMGQNPQLCSFSLSDPIICCPENGTAHGTATAPSSAPRRGGVAKRMCEKYSQHVFQRQEAFVLNVDEPNTIDSCAVPADPLILGGDTAGPKEFPHMARVGYGDEDNIQYQCGGSLIAPNFVMTAAHCLFSTASGQPARWVLLGDLDVSTTKDDAVPQRLEVAEAIKHPGYIPPQRYNDIALLRLKRSAEMTAYVRPACVYTEKTLPTSRSKPLATGWGHTEFGGEPSNMMLKVALPVQPYRLCNTTYRNDVGLKLPEGIRDDTQLCAGVLAGEKDTCQGDSGGPLQIFTGERPYYCMHHVVGVTSFGKACGFKNSPAVYSRVSSFVPWIESVVWPNEQ